MEVPKDKKLRRETTWAALSREFGWKAQATLKGDEAEVLDAPGAGALLGERIDLCHS